MVQRKEQTMKAVVFSVVMNFVAAVVLFSAGATEMNNLGTSIPAILCVIAGICGIVWIKKNK